MERLEVAVEDFLRKKVTQALMCQCQLTAVKIFEADLQDLDERMEDLEGVLEEVTGVVSGEVIEVVLEDNLEGEEAIEMVEGFREVVLS